MQLLNSGRLIYWTRVTAMKMLKENPYTIYDESWCESLADLRMESEICSEEWEIVDYYTEEKEEDEEEKQKWWWWWSGIGKKVVVTGVVISSAPVVLPPLLVVSALGFAMSLPFGVVFASYACTQKLMTKLLPPPQHHYNNLIQEEEEEEEEYEIKNHIQHQQQELEEEKMSSEEEDDIKINGNVEMINELVDDIDDPNTINPLQLVLDLESPSQDDNVDFDEEKPSKQSGDDMSAETKQLGIILMNDDDGNAAPLQKHDDNEGFKDTAAAKKETVILQVHHHHTAGAPAPAPATVAEDVSTVVVADDAGDDHSLELKEEKHDAGDDHSLELKEEKHDAGDDHSLELKEKKQSRQVNGGGLHSDHEQQQQQQGLNMSDEKIWEKINAIRVIVGFKAPRRSSYAEEVKALYLYTGIEPPPPSASPSLDDKLCFLMSVIGLK